MTLKGNIIGNDKQVDTWAVRVMIYELFVGQHPFGGPNEMMFGRRVSQMNTLSISADSLIAITILLILKNNNINDRTTKETSPNTYPLY